MRKPAGLLVTSAAALLLAAVLQAAGAEARVEGRSDYTKAQTYSGALRFLRVDLGYEVVEKDPDAAYLMFRYSPPGRRAESSSGNIEIIETGGEVKVYVQLPQMPEYHERILRDGLMKKLREEYGAPRARPKPPAKSPADKIPDKPPPDAGAS
jgi:hypothetical protein